jgi:hypothetical protein
MKRTFDENPIVSKRPARADRDGIKDLLPEHVGAIASLSLEVLFTMTFADKRWFRVIQERDGAYIRFHKDWCPELRPLVEETFRNAQLGELALEIPLVDPWRFLKKKVLSITREANDNKDYIMIPWTVSVEQWIQWNTWAQAKPSGPFRRQAHGESAEDIAMAEWVDSFQVFPFEWLTGVWTHRRFVLIEETLAQAHYFLVSVLKMKKYADYVIMLSFLSILEATLRRVWGANRWDPSPVLGLIDLFNRWPALHLSADENDPLGWLHDYPMLDYDDNDSDLGPLVYEKTEHQLLLFAFDTHYSSSQNFKAVFQANKTSIHRLFDLQPVWQAIHNKIPLTASLCQSMGEFARDEVRIALGIGIRNVLITARNCYLHRVPSTGVWEAYWKAFDENGLVQAFKDELKNQGIVSVYYY